MNKINKSITLTILLLLIYGCSSQEGNEGSVSEQGAVSQVNPIVENLPEYPNSELPEGLVWQTNNEDPVFADANAKRGGTFNEYMPSFPLTLRTVGPDSNSGIRGYILANHLSLIDIHPNTRNFIPALATHWAYGDDNKTVYFKLNQNAKWSDGKQVTADDFMYTLDFMRSEFIVAPFYNNYYTSEIVDVKKYDDFTISVTGGTAKPKEDLLLYYGISPTPRHFHKLDENWVTDYNWLTSPNTGPYQISAVEKGKYVEFTRNPDWWGNDLKYYQNRFNVDKISISVIRDPETAYRHFLRGELDTTILTFPNYWHDKTNDKTYQNGYIHKIWFYNDLPQPASGIYLNLDNELFQDINVRYGIAHSINIQKMIDTVLRGDYERLHAMHTGYGQYTNTDIRAREFDLEKADEYFAAAGWGERGPDGIRVKEGKRMVVVLAYSTQLHTDRLVVLREEAKKAGLDLQLNLLDSATYYKNVIEKKHQAAWMSWSISLRPSFWQHFHSDNAHKPQTNNITNMDDSEIDELIERYDNSGDVDERAQLAKTLDMKIHESGAYIPSYYVPYVRHGYWRWIKLPEAYGTRLSDTLFDPTYLSLFWIDEEEKQRTLEAMRNNESFEPVKIIDDKYKVTF
jgi:microcin C transport system substrate-binding protein